MTIHCVVVGEDILVEIERIRTVGDLIDAALAIGKHTGRADRAWEARTATDSRFMAHGARLDSFTFAETRRVYISLAMAGGDTDVREIDERMERSGLYGPYKARKGAGR